MKTVVNLSLIFLSSLVILLAPLIPHHHHKDVGCVIVADCSGESATHQKEDCSAKEELWCIKDAEFLVNKTVIYKIFDKAYKCVLMLLVLTLLYIVLQSIGIKYAINDNVCLYEILSIFRVNGLRAPPFILHL